MDMGEYTALKKHGNRKKPLPRPSPGQGTTERLRLLDDFERAAELSASDPFPSDAMFTKSRSSVSAPEADVRISEPEQGHSCNVFDTGPLTPLEHTIAKAFQSQSPKDSQRRRTLHIKHPERVTVESECNPFEDVKYSSDSWTDDDIFLNRPTKLQESQPLISKQVVTYPDIGKPSRPTPRPSRFHRPSPAKTVAPTMRRSEMKDSIDRATRWYRNAENLGPRVGDMSNDAGDEDEDDLEAIQIRYQQSSHRMQRM